MAGFWEVSGGEHLPSLDEDRRFNRF
jgi:hypothetical protein